MNFKVIAMIAALAVAAPVAAIAAPAGGLTAHAYSDTVTAPAVSSDAAVLPGGPAAKVEKVWFRRGFGFRRFGYRGFGYRRFGYGGYGFRRGFYGYGWRRPFFRRRFFF